MKIGWVTPFNDRSSIAGDSQLIAERLAERGDEVSIIRAELGRPAKWPSRSSSLRVYPSGFATPAWIRAEFDVVIYSLGDYWDYHGDALRLLQHHPGIVVIHDVWMAEIFEAWARNLGRPDLYASAARIFYGALPSPNASSEWRLLNQPMTEWAASLGSGAVVHAAHYEQRVRSACGGPVSKLRLPAVRYDLGIPPPRERLTSDPFILATLGTIHPFKMVEETIHAIGASDRLKRLCKYRLIGQPREEMTTPLYELARQLGVSVEITGFLDDRAFADAIAETDAISCLRRPSAEGQAGTLLVALMAQRPTLVCDTASYAEIPDEFVVKIPASAGRLAIRDGIEELIERSASPQIAIAARQWTLDNFSLEGHVEGLRSLAESVLERAPLFDIIRGRAKDMVTLGLSPSDPAAFRLVSAAENLLSNPSAGQWVRKHKPHLTLLDSDLGETISLSGISRLANAPKR